MDNTQKTATRLFVNGRKVELNEFAHQYVTRIVLCAVSMLKGGEKVETLEYTMDSEKSALAINGLAIPLSQFPRDALRGTFSGMASSLRGVQEIKSLRIEMDKARVVKGTGQ
jgi:hypothetical protein